MNTSLNEIADRYADFLALADEDGEEIPQEALRDTFEAIDGELKEKADAIAYVIAALKAKSELQKNESKKLLRWAKAADKRIEYLSQLLKEALERLDKRRLDTGLHRFTLRSNPARLVLENEKGLIDWAKDNDAGLLRFKEPELDKEAVKERLTAGETLPGCSLEKTTSLLIK